MKRVLSNTIALFCTTGISLAMASDVPLVSYEDFEGHANRGRPVVFNNGTPLVNPFPQDGINDSSASAPTTIRNIPGSLLGNGLNSNASRWAQATIDFEGRQESELRHIRAVKSAYDDSIQRLSALKVTQAQLHETAKQKLQEYDEYVASRKLTSGVPKEGETTIVQHIADTQAQIDQQNSPSVVNLDQNTIAYSRHVIEMLSKDQSHYAAAVKKTKMDIDDTEFQMSALQGKALKEASDVYQALLQLKLTTPASLGRDFDRDTLVTPGEVRLALLEMGIPKSVASSNKVAEHFMGAALASMVWPVFSLATTPQPSSTSGATTDSAKTQRGGLSDVADTQSGFLQELKLRTESARGKLQFNYNQNVKSTAALLNLMHRVNIPVALDLQPNELFTHLTTTVANAQPNQAVSLHFNAFITEELFKDYKGVTGKLTANLQPTNATALMLLTGGIANNPTVIEQISSREIPAVVATQAILTAEEGQEANPAAVNAHLLKSLQEITVGRFNMLLLDNIMARLSDVEVR